MNGHIKVQVAIQGGGAKLVNMLAAAHPFATLHRDNNIRITRVSGTSAGAIVAALLAAGADFTKVNTFLRSHGRHYASRLMPDSPAPIRYVRMAALVCKAYLGFPALRQEIMAEFLREMFKASMPTVPDTLAAVQAETGIELKITTSDIFRNQGHIFEPSESLIDSLVSSCAIPVVFRNYRTFQANPYVDGGLCDNLPAELLLSDNDDYGDVFAISPDTEAVTAKAIPSVQSYLLELFNSSINHNVLRSRRLVGSAMTISFRSNLRLLDFHKSLDHLEGSDTYRIIHDHAFDKIRNYARLKTISDEPQGSFNTGRYDPDDLMHSISKIYSQLRALQKFKMLSTTLAVRAFCIDWTQGGQWRSDVAYQQTIFRVFDTPVYCVAINFLGQKDSPFLRPMKWQVKEFVTGKPVEAELIPMRHSSDPARPPRIACAIFFKTPLRSSKTEGEDFCVESYFDAGQAMKGIASAERKDFITLDNQQEHVLETVKLILIAPKSLVFRLDVRDREDSDVKGTILAEQDIIVAYRQFDSLTERVYGIEYKEVAQNKRVAAEFGLFENT